MPFLLVRHKVKSFANWKPAFDEHDLARQAMGSLGGRLFRNIDDPNEVLILLEVQDLAKAREFAGSEELKQVMQRAGVADEPEICFLDEAGRPPK